LIINVYDVEVKKKFVKENLIFRRTSRYMFWWVIL